MRITDFRPRQSKEAAQVAAAAFADDPLWSHTLPDPERRRLPHLIMLGTALRRIGPPQVARVALDGDRMIGFSSWTTAGADDPYDPFDPTRPVDPHMARATRKLVRRAASDWPRLTALSPPLWTMRRPAASNATAAPSEPGGARPS